MFFFLLPFLFKLIESLLIQHYFKKPSLTYVTRGHGIRYESKSLTDLSWITSSLFLVSSEMKSGSICYMPNCFSKSLSSYTLGFLSREQSLIVNLLILAWFTIWISQNRPLKSSSTDSFLLTSSFLKLLPSHWILPSRKEKSDHTFNALPGNLWSYISIFVTFSVFPTTEKHNSVQLSFIT